VLKTKSIPFIMVLSVIFLLGVWNICVQAQDSPYFEMDNQLSEGPPSFLDRLPSAKPKPSSKLSGMTHIPIGKFYIQGKEMFSGYDDEMRKILAIYHISETVIDSLKNNGIPIDITNQLYSIMNQWFIDSDQLIGALRPLLAENEITTYQELIFKFASLYPGQRISPESLHAVSHRLTKYYQKRGYINSIAIIPDQKVVDQVITIKVIEGRLTDISILGNRHISNQYILDRIQSVVNKKGQILNLYELEKELQNCIPLLKLNSRIQNINARLIPGLTIGEATLEIQITEDRMMQLQINVNNHHSPGIGSYCAETSFRHLNPTGHGDAVYVQYGVTEGLDNVAFQYQYPFNERDAGFVLSAERSKSVVIVDDYEHFDLTNTVSSFSFGILWPFYKSLNRTFSMTLLMERLHSKTTFLDMPFPLGGADSNGEADLSIAHCIHEWLFRNNQQVLGFRSTASFGLDMFDITINENRPDARFSTWLLQSQWLRHLDFWNSQLMASFDIRFSDRHLMPSQKFSIGGFRSVRGYRENRITSDDGQLASIQWRCPIGRFPFFLLSRTQSDGRLIGSCFYDYGNARNVDSDDPSPKSISSIGLGLKWNINKQIFAEINWAYALRDLETPEQYDIQDDGIHFQLQMIVY
jgi:hemolysin activation/secretion protein